MYGFGGGLGLMSVIYHVTLPGIVYNNILHILIFISSIYIFLSNLCQFKINLSSVAHDVV